MDLLLLTLLVIALCICVDLETKITKALNILEELKEHMNE